MVPSRDQSAFYLERSTKKLPTSHNPENDAVLHKIITSLDVAAGDAVLDFGCADGYFISQLTQKVPGIAAFGVDLVWHDSWLAYEGTVSFTAHDLPLPFPDESFDAVFSSQVFEHLSDPKFAAEEIDRVLKPGGRIWIATPNSYRDTWRPFRRFQQRVDAIEGHVRHFSAPEIVNLFPPGRYAAVSVRYDLFIGLYLYYRFVSYNPSIKKLALGVIAPELMSSNCGAGLPEVAPLGRIHWLRKTAFALLRALRAFDTLFSRSRLCQVVEVALLKENLL